VLAAGGVDGPTKPPCANADAEKALKTNPAHKAGKESFRECFVMMMLL
jgi:hypothetical protein